MVLDRQFKCNVIDQVDFEPLEPKKISIENLKNTANFELVNLKEKVGG